MSLTLMLTARHKKSACFVNSDQDARKNLTTISAQMLTMTYIDNLHFCEPSPNLALI